jgi:calcium-dependent protein kinase
MKIINKSHIIFGVNEQDIKNEIRILKSLDHMNILKIYEFFKDQNFYYIITEYFQEGDLFTKLISEKKRRFDETVVWNIMKQLLNAVSYLHSKKVFHGDIKLENILVDSSSYSNSSFRNLENAKLFDIKIIDFGCSKIFCKDLDDNIGLKGSANYIAPEVLENNQEEISDIWSCGVVMYILLSGKMPFGGDNDLEILNNVKKGKFSLEISEFNIISNSAIDLIKGLMTYNAKERLTAKSALKHPWFKKNNSSFINFNLKEFPIAKEVLENLLNFNANGKFQQAVITFIVHNLIKSEDINDLRHIFKIIDSDNDGRISIKDISNAFLLVLDKRLNNSEIENLMKAVDHDNNGYIEYEEFLRGTIDKKLILNENNLIKAFDFFDTDSNGLISSKEIIQIISDGKNLSDEVIEEVLREIGLDKFEKFENKNTEGINFNEFKLIINQIFEIPIKNYEDEYKDVDNEKLKLISHLIE